MTVDIYGHLIPGLNRQAVDKLEIRRLRAEKPQTVTDR
jgi:hypothetical protein